jgi:ADP-ribose pyrophosphatase YjhB (NUDIX family)
MVVLKHYEGIGKKGEKIKITIASGPVIIENNKVLLDKHGEDKFWKFPGGTQLDNSNFIDNAKREVKEELGIEIKLIDDEPCVMCFTRKHNDVKEYVVLNHYLAKRVGEVKPGRDVREYVWMDVNSLRNCAPNIKPVVNYFLKR